MVLRRTPVLVALLLLLAGCTSNTTQDAATEPETCDAAGGCAAVPIPPEVDFEDCDAPSAAFVVDPPHMEAAVPVGYEVPLRVPPTVVWLVQHCKMMVLDGVAMFDDVTFATTTLVVNVPASEDDVNRTNGYWVETLADEPALIERMAAHGIVTKPATFTYTSLPNGRTVEARGEGFAYLMAIQDVPAQLDSEVKSGFRGHQAADGVHHHVDVDVFFSTSGTPAPSALTASGDMGAVTLLGLGATPSYSLEHAGHFSMRFEPAPDADDGPQ